MAQHHDLRGNIRGPDPEPANQPDWRWPSRIDVRLDLRPLVAHDHRWDAAAEEGVVVENRHEFDVPVGVRPQSPWDREAVNEPRDDIVHQRGSTSWRTCRRGRKKARLCEKQVHHRVHHAAAHAVRGVTDRDSPNRRDADGCEGDSRRKRIREPEPGSTREEFRDSPGFHG